MLLAAARDERHRLVRRDPRLLRLEPDIDLHIDRQPAPRPLHLGLQHARELVAIDGLDHIEQRHRLARLVGLQRPDQMQFYAVIGSPQLGHLACAS